MAAKVSAKKSKTRVGEPAVQPSPSGAHVEEKADSAQAADKRAAQVFDTVSIRKEFIKPASPKGWWARLKERLEGRRRRDEGVREHLAAVKAGVMHELETISAEKGVPLSGQPFRNIVLPQARSRRPWMWPLLTAAVVVGLVVLVMFNQNGNDPALALRQALVAAHTGDMVSFEKNVDVVSVTNSVADQLFPGLPQPARAGLVNALGNGLKAAIERGSMPGNEPGALLDRLWDTLGGKDIHLGQVHMAMQNEQVAVAELPLQRSDLGLTLPLQVVLGKQSGSDWKVVDVPNLGAVMESFSQATALQSRPQQELGGGGSSAAVEPSAGSEQVAVEPVKPSDIEVSGVRKQPGAKIDTLVIALTATNKGAAPLTAATFKVVVGDAAGQLLRTFDVPLGEALPAGDSRRVLAVVQMDRARAFDRYVMDLPLSALTVRVVPVIGAKG